eukprot:CAMPEP_0206137642 /NCGR_PEP_ID=MMETSP1473-20131121/2730_1 /ASSEMBLY_ACC=CAM_ASM_001109 /TAXON_ID=1461547 /ORGANISM="Stichococcus sp, Strain RCC1054" /LENGTH=556 /DNA_ID=CAMNT_0053530829 /DNA_START=165 /DNA_END=1835 /DNA_ORIENTATION=-
MLARLLHRDGLARSAVASATLRTIQGTCQIDLCSSLLCGSAQSEANAIAPLQLISLRAFASSSTDGSEGSGGPPRSKIRAIPFIVTPMEALQTFEDHHSGSIFNKRPSEGLSKQKEAFLPFWITSATIVSDLRSAEVGHQVWATVYNPRTRRVEQQLEMQYQQVAFDVAFEQTYPAGGPGSAVYGSWKYPRRSIAHVAPAGAAVRLAQHFSSDMLNATSGEASMRRVGPFDIRPAAALAESMAAFQRQANTEARTWIMQQIKCDDVRNIYLAHTVLESRCSPVYAPVYVFQSRHLGNKVHTFVSGCVPNMAAGTRMLDERRVAFIGGLAGAAAVLLFNAWQTAEWTTLLWGWVLPPALLAGLAARVYPGLILQLTRAYQERQRQQGQQDQRPWDEEYVGEFREEATYGRAPRMYRSSGRQNDETSAFADFFRRAFGQETVEEQTHRRQQAHRAQQAEWRRRQQQQQQQQSRSGSQPRRPSGDPGDPGGYYKRLNVRPSATKSEIQAAFRGMAQRWHPDHVAESEKKLAADRFREAVEAYTILRDDRKRADYDRGIF